MEKRMKCISEETEWGHEVRMHMQILISGIQMLRCCGISEEKRAEYLEILDRHARTVKKMAEETMENQSLLHRQAQMKWEELPRILRECARGMQGEILRKELTVLEDIEENRYALTDRHMLGRVFDNLLYNAIKFSERKGTIHLSLQKRGEMVEILISDTGCGMEKERMNRIFEWREEAFSRGHGFGLPMCACLIEKLGGTIECESQKGKGSTFMICLPCCERGGNAEKNGCLPA